MTKQWKNTQTVMSPLKSCQAQLDSQRMCDEQTAACIQTVQHSG